MAMNAEQLAQVKQLLKELRAEDNLLEEQKRTQARADAEDARVGEEANREEKRSPGKLFDKDFHKESKSFV